MILLARFALVIAMLGTPCVMIYGAGMRDLSLFMGAWIGCASVCSALGIFIENGGVSPHGGRRA